MKLELVLLFALLLSVGVWCGRFCSKQQLRKKEKFNEGYYNALQDDVLFPFVYKSGQFRTRLGALSDKTQDPHKNCKELKSRVDKCFKNFKDDLKTFCSENKNLTLPLRIYSDSFYEAMKTKCRDNAKHIIDFVDKTNKVCYAETTSPIRTCLDDNPLATITTDYSESFCNRSKEALKCIKEKINIPYCNEFGQNFIYEFYELRRSNTPCGKSK